MKTIQSVLAGDYFSRLWEENNRLQKLQTTVCDILTANMIAADDCRVVSLKNNELRLLVESAALAVRTRQILPTLRRSLNNKGFFVHKIILTVNTP